MRQNRHDLFAVQNDPVAAGQDDARSAELRRKLDRRRCQGGNRLLDGPRRHPFDVPADGMASDGQTVCRDCDIGHGLTFEIACVRRTARIALFSPGTVSS